MEALRLSLEGAGLGEEGEEGCKPTGEKKRKKDDEDGVPPPKWHEGTALAASLAALSLSGLDVLCACFFCEMKEPSQNLLP